jgi:superfamily II DNA or RNA helicase
MTREEVQNTLLSSVSNNFILQLPTSFGKSKLALQKVKQWSTIDSKILIVIPRLVLKQNWIDEINKWNYGDLLPNVTFTTYVSLPKHCGELWDAVLMDECFRGDTEILTNTGYKQFKNLTEDDLVAQFTQEGNIEFVKPLRLIKRNHTGNICKLHLGRNRFCYLTPNHNMVYKTDYIDGWKMKPVSDLTSTSYTRIPVSGKGTGDNTILTPVERLFIAIQADGALQRHQINESVYSIQLTKERKKERMKSILRSYEADKYSTIKGRKGCDRYLIKLPKGDAKLLKTHFNINMGFTRANSFIEEILEWDGSRKYCGNTVYYSSVIKENADFVAAVAIQAGYKALVSVEEDTRKESFNPVYRVFMRKIDKVCTQQMTKEYIPYNDDVYCVEVPTHMIVVRSEGYSFIAGNCHHTSERCQEALKVLHTKHLIGLSATIKKDLLWFFRNRFKVEVIQVKVKDAIESNVLPDPKVILIPLTFNNTIVNQVIEKNIKKTANEDSIKTINFSEKWKYRGYKGPLRILCTQQQYYNDISNLIDWYKQKGMHNAIMKNMWLHKAGERLKWLAKQKEELIKQILKELKNYRVLTFCQSIEQSETLGCPCVNSKVGTENLEKFNNKKIKHIASIDMLNEGLNPVDCKVGLFQMLNSSQRISWQRAGRILRHKEPVLIFPYYINSREEEILKDILQDYNKDLIIKLSINSINNLKELLK